MFSPSARDGQLLSLSSASAAGGNFRFATKVTKGAPKKGKTTVRSGFLPFLWNLTHLSTDRGSPPRINARGLTGTVSLGSSHDVGASIQISQRRGDCLFAIENISPRTLAVRRRSAIRRKEKGFPKGKGKQPERVSLFPLVRLCLLSPHSESKCLPGTRAS